MSRTWDRVADFELGLDPHLGFGGSANYGYDTVAFDEEIIVPSQIVGIINTTDHWLGFLGLGIAVTNFTGEIKLPFLSSMQQNQSLIPSHSYGYTAGAYHRKYHPITGYRTTLVLTCIGLKHVPASLTLGGYDAYRFESHNISFNLDFYQNPVVAINEITVSAQPLPTSRSGTGWSTNPLFLLGPGEADLFTIDSSTPFLWLPETVCQRFEEALGLTYDTNLQLYTFGTNTSHRDALVNWNMTFSFVIADLPGSTKLVNITLPYAAFDLQLSYPFPGLTNVTAASPATRYFPLRKAANSTQYTIGRSFLQEAYLIVDYERNNFSVHQATFTVDALTKQNLVNIDPPTNSTMSNREESGSGSLSKGAIIGTAVGCAVGLAILIALLIFYLKKCKPANSDEKSSSPQKPFFHFLCRDSKPSQPCELLGTTKYPVEIHAKSRAVELPATLPQELEGTEVTKYPTETQIFEDESRNQSLTLIVPPSPNTKHLIPSPHELHPAHREYYGPGPGPGPKPGPSPPTPPAYSPDHVGRSSNGPSSGNVSRDSSARHKTGANPTPSPTSPAIPVSPQTHTYRSSSPLSPGHPISPISPQAPYTTFTQMYMAGNGNSPVPTTSRDVSRESSPLTTPGLSPSTPGRSMREPGVHTSQGVSMGGGTPRAVTPGSAQAFVQNVRAGVGENGNGAVVGRNDSRASRFTEEGISNNDVGDRDRRDRAGTEGRHERYSWEDDS